MQGQRLRYLAAIVALAVATLAGFGPPYVIRATIDGVIAGQTPDAPAWVLDWIEAAGGASALAKYLWVGAAAILGLTGLSGLFSYLKGRWAAKASERITRNLRDHLYDRLQHLPCAYHDSTETGDQVQRCTSDVDTIRLFLGTQIVDLVRAIANLVFVLPIMVWLDWRMAVASTAVLPVIVAFAVIFFAKVQSTFKRMDESEGALTSRLQENLTGIRVVRAFARQQFEREKFEQRNHDYCAKNRSLYAVFAWYWSTSDFLVFVQMGLSLFAGAYWVGRGEANGGISVGTLVAFWMYVGMVVWPVRMMGRTLAELGKALISLDRVEGILETDIETESTELLTQSPPRLEGRIEFASVSFSHGSDLPVLRDLSFVLEPGQTLAIVGPSGSGKSTIVNLLLRFYEPDTGTIRVDGLDLHRIARKYIRAQIGAVLQEPFLFSKSLRENLKLGRHDAPDDSMVEMATVAAVHESIEQFDEGYDTKVGERGVTLSGGQRQRVALARALLRDPPILILDDAFSAVDTRTESMILDALRQRHGRHSTVVIAHRLATLMHADQIIVVEHGQVTQCGSHGALIEQDGLYRRLWEIQTAVDDGAVEQPLETQGPGPMVPVD